MLSNGSVEAIHRSLNELGYSNALIKKNWMPRTVIPGEDAPYLSLTAFWGRPFDQFRSAVAVTEKNGIPTKNFAKRIALRTLSHVLLCDDEEIELWLLDATDIRQHKNRVPIDQIESLVNNYSRELDRSIVAEQKIRLRQYALYEADPKGRSFGEWAVRPSIDQASKELSRLVAEIMPKAANETSGEHNNDKIRWLFRTLALRVGRDLEWDVASDLGREAVSEFAERAKHYPRPWLRSSTKFDDTERLAISERVLEKLIKFEFSTVDPIFVVKAFRSPALRRTRAAIDLFPTPRPYAWDMMASIPLREGMGICDPTVGTGTFLVAAGHALWSTWASKGDAMPNLRDWLYGTDHSSLSTDFARIALDLAFGWDKIGWQIDEERAETSVTRLSLEREWVLVGNLPWDGKGKSRNKAAKMLDLYTEILAKRRSGWIATISPRSIWTNRSPADIALRGRIASDFQIESVWELPWGAITGGRAQAVATVISRGQPITTTIWKRLDHKGIVHTIGYTPSSQRVDDRLLLSADARHLQRRLIRCSKLGDLYNVRIGLQLKKVDDVPKMFRGGGDLPFMKSLHQMRYGDTKPAYIRYADISVDSEWTRKFLGRTAHDYRSEIHMLPQIAMPQRIYEGVRNLQTIVFEQPLLLSNRFFVCTPRSSKALEFARGVAMILTSTLGRLWLHLFAFAGRDLSPRSMGKFPLPSNNRITRIGSAYRASRFSFGTTSYELFHPTLSLEEELEICTAYDFEKKEGYVILGLGCILGYNHAIPYRWAQECVSDQGRLEQLLDELDKLTPEADPDHRSRLCLYAVAEQEKDGCLILRGEDYEVSIDKSSVADEQYNG